MPTRKELQQQLPIFLVPVRRDRDQKPIQKTSSGNSMKVWTRSGRVSKTHDGTDLAMLAIYSFLSGFYCVAPNEAFHTHPTCLMYTFVWTVCILFMLYICFVWQ